MLTSLFFIITFIELKCETSWCDIFVGTNLITVKLIQIFGFILYHLSYILKKFISLTQVVKFVDMKLFKIVSSYPLKVCSGHFFFVCIFKWCLERERGSHRRGPLLSVRDSVYVEGWLSCRKQLSTAMPWAKRGSKWLSKNSNG